MNTTGIIINRRLVKEASIKFLSSIPSLKEDLDLLEATAEDLTSTMIQVLLLSLESDEEETEPIKKEAKEEPQPPTPPLSDDELIMHQESLRMRSSFLTKMQERARNRKPSF